MANTAGALSGAASGAAIGTAIMPGIGTAIGAIAGGLLGSSSVAGGASGGGGGGGGDAKPMASQAAAFGSGLDGSGWQVTIGNNNAQTLDNRQDKTMRDIGGPTANAATRTTYDPYLTSDGQMSGLFGSMGYVLGVPVLVWVFVGAAVVYRLNKKKG